MSSRTHEEDVCSKETIVDNMECDVCHSSKDKEDAPSGFDSSFMSVTWHAGYDAGENDGRVFSLDICHQCMARLGKEVK